MNNLRRARLIADLSQLQLMRKTKIFYSTISKIEKGWIKPTNEQKKKLAAALDADAAWLFPPGEES